MTTFTVSFVTSQTFFAWSGHVWQPVFALVPAFAGGFAGAGGNDPGIHDGSARRAPENQ